MTGVPRRYPWGSITAIPEFLEQQVGSEPLAELWFGAHPTGASHLPESGKSLAEYIASAPAQVLGQEVFETNGARLPYLVKFLAPAAPLSMQVHPNAEQARAGFAEVQAGGPGASIDYVDGNHKPELLLPLTDFEVLCGLRPATEVLGALRGLSHPLLGEVRALLEEHPEDSSHGFAHLLGAITAPDVLDVAQQVRARLAAGASPVEHSDEILIRLQHAHPGDRGVIASLFLTPRRLRPGEVMFVPAGVVHAYLDGLGVEVMANSDNVLRAGLTSKHVDVPELLHVMDPGADVLMLSPQPASAGVERYSSPVADFEVSVITGAQGAVEIDEPGPRIVLALQDAIRVQVDDPPPGALGMRVLARGEAVFLPACVGAVSIRGGRAVHVGVPVSR